MPVRTLATPGRAPTETRYLSDGGNKIVVNNEIDKRVIPLEEVANKAYYEDMAVLAKIFSHEIIEDKNGVWRWKANLLTTWLYEHGPVYTPSGASDHADGNFPYTQKSKKHRASIELNTLWGDLYNGMFTLEEMMKFYMQIGYSLSGYGEVFGQKEAAEMGLPGAKPKPDEESDDYTETVLEYVIRIHKDKVLSL